MIQHCLHNNCGSLSLALIMRLLSSSAVACRLGFTRSCLPVPRARGRARAEGFEPGLPSPAPGFSLQRRGGTVGLGSLGQLLKVPGGGGAS